MSAFTQQNKDSNGRNHRMFSMIRKRMTYANVAMTLALVFAMSSGAYAAKKYLITSTKQISPSVLKQLVGKNGLNGKNGTAGAQGPAGAAGPAGPPGPSSGPAGGVLTGSYPNPGLAAGVVATANFAAGAQAPDAAKLGGTAASSWQMAIGTGCLAGEAIRDISQSGTVTCQSAGSGTVSEVKTGTGLEGGPITKTGELSVNFAQAQKRVASSECSSGGKAIKRIKETGEVECEATGEKVFPTLEKGKTETGSWASTAPANGGPALAVIPISFSIPLATKIGASNVHIVNLTTKKELVTVENEEEELETKEVASSACTAGNEATPTAVAGNLCVYVGHAEFRLWQETKLPSEPGRTPNLFEAGATAPVAGASQSGAIMEFYPKSASVGPMWGMWAVTAP